jgi:radical SAM superfamily enzyme YgiQ (UPF0313 family)
MGTSFRARTPEAIVQEMAECQGRFGIGIFDIEDDNFTFDQERAKRLMNLVIETFGEEKIELSAMNGVSLASLDGELLGLMKRAGFKTINLSYVSTDPTTKERMGRPKAKTPFDQILEEAEKVGLSVIAYAIVGMPGQTIEEMVDTLIYLMGKRVLVGPSIYYPTPGTPLFEKCKQDDLLPLHPCQWRSSAFPIETKEFSRIDLVTLFRLSRVINFIKAKMDGEELEEGLTWEELFISLKEKRKSDHNIEMKDENESGRYALCAMPFASFNVTWVDLLLMLEKERSFFSLRKDSGGRIFISKVESSRKVLDCFLEKARQRLILKSHSPVVS